jgi:hypothetical protein
MTGEDLAILCKGGDEDKRFCVAYVTGWEDARYAFLKDKIQNPYCLPLGITTEEMSLAFVDFLASHKVAQRLLAATALQVAFQETWPCPR